MATACIVTFFLFGVTVEVESACGVNPSVEQVDYGVTIKVDDTTIRVYNPPDPAPGNIG